MSRGCEEIKVTPLSRAQLDAFRFLLKSEADLWRKRLCWDFTSTARALESALSSNSLPGFLALSGDRPLGYIYWVKQREKTVLGSLFSGPGEANRSVDMSLVQRCVETLRTDASVRRIEGQLLYFGSAPLHSLLEAYGFSSFSRCFMIADISPAQWSYAASEPAGYKIIPFNDTMISDVAKVVYRSYVGELDSRLSECYQTGWGCLNFINTIAKRNGIGKFSKDASRVAVSENGEVVGAVLATIVSRETGHIPQISVAPEHQGRGLGRSLVRGCLDCFKERRFLRVSLSVTKKNSKALKLYENAAFQTVLEFPAFYWQNDEG